METSSPNLASTTAFSHLELFLEILLARKYGIISHAFYLPTSLTNKNLLAVLFKHWTRHPQNFLMQVPFFLILLWNQVFWKAKLRIITMQIVWNKRKLSHGRKFNYNTSLSIGLNEFFSWKSCNSLSTFLAFSSEKNPQ